MISLLSFRGPHCSTVGTSSTPSIRCLLLIAYAPLLLGVARSASPCLAGCLFRPPGTGCYALPSEEEFAPSSWLCAPCWAAGPASTPGQPARRGGGGRGRRCLPLRALFLPPSGAHHQPGRTAARALLSLSAAALFLLLCIVRRSVP